MKDEHRMKGRLRLELRTPDGVTIDARNARNTVVQTGGEIVAALFSGKSVVPVNGMGVGANPEPVGPPYALTSLSLTGDGGAPAFEGAAPITAVALAPDSFAVETLADELRVRVTIRGVIPPGVATGLIGEAALGVLGTAAGPPLLERIYNRVVFEPLRKESAHELALYWEISFPYGP